MQSSSLIHGEVENMVVDANCGWAVEVMCQFGLCMCPPDFPYCINREEKPAKTEKQILKAQLEATYKRNYRQKKISRRPINIQISMSSIDGAEEEKMNMSSFNPRYVEEKIILSKSSHDHVDLALQFTLPSIEVESSLINQTREDEGNMFCLPALPTGTPEKIENKLYESNEDSKTYGPILGFLTVHEDADSNDGLSVGSPDPKSSLYSFDDGAPSPMMEISSPFNLTDHKIEPSLEKLCSEIAQLNLNFKYFEQNITSLIERKFDSLLAQFDLANGKRLNMASGANKSSSQQMIDTPTLIPPLPGKIQTSDRLQSFHPCAIKSGKTSYSSDGDVFEMPHLPDQKSTSKRVSSFKSISGDNLFPKISGRLEGHSSVSDDMGSY